LVGVELKAYYADKGCFADKGFQNDWTSSNQTFPSVKLIAIIKMALLSKKSKILLLGLGLCFCMPNKCSLRAFLLFFGCLL
jgi:hypothetical protein